MPAECHNALVRPLGSAAAVGEMWDRLQAKSPYPLSVLMSLTGRCNATCRHCETLHECNANNELSLGEIRRVLDDLKSVGVLSVLFTGGEPALRRDLTDIIQYAVDNGFYTELKSNGTLLHDHRIQALISAGLGSIHFSVYHDNPELHDDFVGIPGAWSAVMHVATALRRAQVHVRFSIVAMSWNISAVPRLLDLCEKEDFAFMIDMQIAPKQDGDRSPLQLQAEASQIATLLKHPRILNPNGTFTLQPKGPDDPICGAGGRTCYIDFNGDVLPCGRLHLPLGNLLQNDFAAIWERSEVRARLQNIRWKSLPVCHTCEKSGLCSRCLASAMGSDSALIPPVGAECNAAEGMKRRINELKHKK